MNARYGRTKVAPEKSLQVTEFNTPSKNRAPYIPKTEAKEGDVLSFFDEGKGKTLTSFDGGYQVTSTTRVSDKDRVETGSVITDSLTSRLGLTTGQEVRIKAIKPNIRMYSERDNDGHIFVTNDPQHDSFDPVNDNDNTAGNAQLQITVDRDVWLNAGNGLNNDGGINFDWYNDGANRRIEMKDNAFRTTVANTGDIDIGTDGYYWRNLFIKGNITGQSGDMAITAAGDMTITATGGDIGFGNANLSTSGTLASGAHTVTGTMSASTDITVPVLKITSDGLSGSASIQLNADGQDDLGIWVPATDTIGFTTNNEDSFRMTTGVFYSGYDDIVDLGKSDKRWDDIYATNGTIQTSDSRLKESISDSALGLNFLNELRPVQFKFKDKTRRHYGLLAQEVEQVLSDSGISTTDFAPLIHDGDSDRYGMRYSEFTSILIKAIQELSKEVEELKKE